MKFSAFAVGALTSVVTTFATAQQPDDSPLKGDIFGGGDSLVGSWSSTQSFDLGDGMMSSFFAVITFSETRITYSVEFDDLDELFPGGLIATGVYGTNTAANPNQLTIDFETLDGEPFESTFNSIYEIAGETLRLGSNQDGTFPASFALAGFVEEYESVGTRSICSQTSISALMSDLAMLQSMANLPADLDNDGVPEDAILELVNFLACDGAAAKVPNRTEITDAVQSAFLVNVSALQQSGAGQFAELAALLSLSSGATQAGVRAALVDLGFTVPENLSLVTCDDNNCRADAALVNEILSGDGDLDGDGMTNRQEFDSSGGNIDTFLTTATDNIPNFNGGCASAPGQPLSGLSGDALLVALAMVLLLLAYRRRANV